MAKVDRVAALPRLAALTEDRRGAVSVLGDLAMTSVIDASGFAVEAGERYMTGIRNQPVADMASLGAALAHTSNATNGTMAGLNAEADQIALANGVSADAIEASIVTSPADPDRRRYR
jgi:uncharacterized membrane protein